MDWILVSFRGRWVPRVQVTLAPMMWTVLLFTVTTCVNWFQVRCSTSHNFESDTAWVLLESILCLCWDFLSQRHYERIPACWESCACCSIVMLKTSIAKLEYVVNCLWWRLSFHVTCNGTDFTVSFYRSWTHDPKGPWTEPRSLSWLLNLALSSAVLLTHR